MIQCYVINIDAPKVHPVLLIHIDEVSYKMSFVKRLFEIEVRKNPNTMNLMLQSKILTSIETNSLK